MLKKRKQDHHERRTKRSRDFCEELEDEENREREENESEDDDFLEWETEEEREIRLIEEEIDHHRVCGTRRRTNGGR
jgi:hypothetical protein